MLALSKEKRQELGKNGQWLYGSDGLLASEGYVKHERRSLNPAAPQTLPRLICFAGIWRNDHLPRYIENVTVLNSQYTDRFSFFRPRGSVILKRKEYRGEFGKVGKAAAGYPVGRVPCCRTFLELIASKCSASIRSHKI
jgi:hypothetical protein